MSRRPLWPAMPPPNFSLRLARREVELVVDDEHLVGRDARRSAPAPPPRARTGSCRCRASAAAGRPTRARPGRGTCASLDERRAQPRGERVGEPEARRCAGWRRARGRGCRGRRRDGSEMRARWATARRDQRKGPPRLHAAGLRRRGAIGTGLLLLRLPCRRASFFSSPLRRLGFARPASPPRPRPPSAAAAARLGLASSTCAFGTTAAATTGSSLPRATTVTPGGELQSPTRARDWPIVERRTRSTSMNSGRSFGRQAMSSSFVTWLTIAPETLTAGETSLVDEVQRHLHVDLAVLVDALEVDVQDLVLERVHLDVAQQHLGRGCRRASSSGSTRGTPRCAARGRARCGRARSAAARWCRRRRCRGPCRRGACGGWRRGLRSVRGKAVNSNCMAGLLDVCGLPGAALRRRARPVVRGWRHPGRASIARGGESFEL